MSDGVSPWRRTLWHIPFCYVYVLMSRLLHACISHGSFIIELFYVS